MLLIIRYFENMKLIALFLLIPLSAFAQPFGQHLTKYLRQPSKLIISDFGSIRMETSHYANKVYSYEAVIGTNNRVIRPYKTFYLVDDKVAMSGEVVEENRVNYWRNQFQTHLTHLKDIYWLNPVDRIIWALKFENGLWLVEVLP